jgi:hypothetical protein
LPEGEAEIAAPRENSHDGDTRSPEAAHADHFPTDSGNPRATAIASMFEHAAKLAAAGDLAGARALHAAIAAMLGEGGEPASKVVALPSRATRGK